MVSVEDGIAHTVDALPSTLDAVFPEDAIRFAMDTAAPIVDSVTRHDTISTAVDAYDSNMDAVIQEDAMGVATDAQPVSPDNLAAMSDIVGRDVSLFDSTPPQGMRAVSIARARNSAMATENGRVWFWGSRLPTDPPDSTDNNMPRRLQGISNAVRLPYGSHSLAIDADGYLWGWFATSPLANVSEFVPVAMRFEQLGPLRDVFWRLTACVIQGSSGICGLPWQRRRVVWSVGVVNVSGYFRINCAVLENGAVECAIGDPIDAELGFTQTLPGIDGVVYDGTPRAIPGLPPVVQVDINRWHSCAVARDGGLWCWGVGHYGQLGTGSEGPRCRWNPHTYPPRDLPDEFNWRVSACTTRPVRVPGFNDVVKVSVSEEMETCALRRDGSVWCWGSNADGQLGVGPTSDDCRDVTTQRVNGVYPTGPMPCVYRPRRLAIPVPVADVVVSRGGCALGRDGSVWCWGQSPGDGLPGMRDHPVRVCLPC